MLWQWCFHRKLHPSHSNRHLQKRICGRVHQGNVIWFVVLQLPNFSLISKSTSWLQISNVGTNDVFPPSQVTDLRAAINLEEDTIKLSFTAPGDDYNAGTGKIPPNPLLALAMQINILANFPFLYATASRYQLFSSADSFALVTEDFSNENVTEIKDEDLSSGTLLPVLGNSEVVLTLAKSAVLLSGGKIIRSADQGENNLYFRMKFYDEGDNQSSSNIDSVSLGVPSFPEPEESSTTTTTTTTTTATTTASTTANPTDSTTQTTITDAPSTTTSSTETPMASSTTTTTTVGTTTSDAPTLSTTSKESTTTTDSEPSTTALSGAQNYLQSSFLTPLSLLFSLSFIFWTKTLIVANWKSSKIK